ncbi:MAG: hypothetical protein IJN95_06430 [Clostridia bacterium]|nr:hypothetical protein [Clostridia bacterium]
MKNKNRVKLYNVLFPFWMLLLFPQVWLVILPGNFIIDSLVLIIGMVALKIADKKQWYKKHIFKIFLFGMLSDIIAAGYMFLMVMTVLKDVIVMADELYLTLPAVIMAAALIFVLNYFFTFKKDEKLLRLKFSLIFAVVTAPYTFLIPSSWMY